MSDNFELQRRQAKLRKTLFSFAKTMAILITLQIVIGIGFWQWGKFVALGFLISIVSQLIKYGAVDTIYNEDNYDTKKEKKQDKYIEDRNNKPNELDLDSHLRKEKTPQQNWKDSDFV